MVALCREVGQALDGFVLRDVAEVGCKTWLLFFEKGEEVQRLLICTQFPVGRFHLAKRRYRGVSSPFADQLRGVLRGKKVQGVGLLNRDRIFALSLEGVQLIAAFISRSPRLLLLDADQKVVLSLPPCSSYVLPEKKVVHVEVPSACSSEEVEERFWALQQELELEALRKDLSGRLGKQLQKIERRLALHRLEREEAEGYPEAEYRAQLLQANYPRLQRGLKEIEVADWKREGEMLKIPLEPDLLPKKQIERAFKYVRKLKGRLHASLRWITELEEEKRVLEDLKRDLEACEETVSLEKIAQEHPFFAPARVETKKEKEARRCFRMFKTEAGCAILVGKSDRDNDRLTFSVARGNDLWLHAANFPGSHVVLQRARNQEIDEASLQDALLLALHFSKARESEVEEVTFTECKHVSKQKGAPLGKVVVSAAKTRRVVRNPERLRALLSGQG